MRKHTIIILMAVIAGLHTNALARSAKAIDVNSLNGNIFFIGARETTEFKGKGSVRQLYEIKANGLECHILLPSLPRVSDLTVYPKLKKLTFNSISSDESKHGQLELDIREPRENEPLEARLKRPLSKDFPIKFQHKFVADSYWPIAFSPDGSAVAGIADGGLLHIVDVKNGASTKVAGQFIHENEAPAWSPDGTRVVFRGCVFDSMCNETELFIVDRDGKNLHQITNNPRPYSWWTLLFTPDARKPKYKEQHNVTSPAWSPDGQWIAFGSFDNIFKIRPDGSDLTLVVKDAVDPTWSPDGKMIAYAALRDDVPRLTKDETGGKSGYHPPNIYVSWADGTGETRITNNRKELAYFELKWVE